MIQRQSVKDGMLDDRICGSCGATVSRVLAHCSECGAALAADPLIGKQIDERYEVLRCLGQGGMGTVYEVQHLRLRKRFAMKFIRSDFAAVPGFSARFEREALATSKQKHPNCVAVTDFGHARTGELYLVMEFIEGQSLRQLLGRPMPVQRALSVGRQILLALQHAHRNGIVHRDIKADNMMLVDGPDGGWIVKVLDFGLAVPADANGPDQVGEREVLAGTPTYMAPEQFTRKQTDERSDLYAVGVVLWYLLTGRPVFDAETPIGVLRRKAAEPAPPIDSVVPGVFSVALQELLAKALERAPEDRFCNAEAFLAALSEVQRSRGGGLATAPSNFLSRALLRSGRAIRVAWTDWYRCVGYEKPSWWTRMRQLSSVRNGRIVLLSMVVVVAIFALSAIGISQALHSPAKSSSNGSLTPARQVVVDLTPSAAAPIQSTAELERRLALVRLLISKGACREAALDVEALLRDQPNLALAHQLRGAAEFCRGRTSEAFSAYEQAIALDPRFHADSRIVEDVGSLLGSPVERDRALTFLIRHVGREALGPLIDATTSKDAAFRARAVAQVRALGAASRIDWVTVYHLDLEQQADCRARARAIAALTQLKDRRALSVLLDAQRARGRNRRSKHACVKRELERAIKRMRARLK